MGAPESSVSDYMQVFCSWDSSSKNVVDCIKITHNTSSKVSLDDVVDFERCIQLFANDDSSYVPCTINFKLEKNYMISKLAIASEAKIFELYGSCEEYLGTHHAEYIDTFEDMEVFLAEIDVALSNECSLKLAKMKTKNSMWVYGLYISIAELNPSPKPGIDLNRVEERLKMSNQPLTNKAFKCKEFLKMYNMNLPSITQTKVPDPILILKMLEGEFLTSLLSQTESSNSTSPFHLSSLLSKDSHPNTTSTDRRNSHSSAQESGLCSENEFAMVQTELKYYVDKKFLMLENKLIGTINCKLKLIEDKYSAKVDKILNLLEKMNCVSD